MSHLERLSETFPDVPPTVLLKAELLRCGVRLADAPGHLHRHGENRDVRLHGSIELPGGVYSLTAHNAASPYVLLVGERGRRLTLGVDSRKGFEPIVEVKPGPRFRWTSARTSRGTPMATLFAPSAGGACGPLAVFLLRQCEFLANHEECRFCSWVRMGRPSESR